jgi:hypothetical protein
LGRLGLLHGFLRFLWNGSSRVTRDWDWGWDWFRLRNWDWFSVRNWDWFSVRNWDWFSVRNWDWFRLRNWDWFRLIWVAHIDLGQPILSQVGNSISRCLSSKEVFFLKFSSFMNKEISDLLIAVVLVHLTFVLNSAEEIFASLLGV